MEGDQSLVSRTGLACGVGNRKLDILFTNTQEPHSQQNNLLALDRVWESVQFREHEVCGVTGLWPRSSRSERGCRQWAGHTCGDGTKLPLTWCCRLKTDSPVTCCDLWQWLRHLAWEASFEPRWAGEHAEGTPQVAAHGSQQDPACLLPCLEEWLLLLSRRLPGQGYALWGCLGSFCSWSC